MQNMQIVIGVEVVNWVRAEKQLGQQAKVPLVAVSFSWPVQRLCGDFIDASNRHKSVCFEAQQAKQTNVFLHSCDLLSIQHATTLEEIIRACQRLK